MSLTILLNTGAKMPLVGIGTFLAPPGEVGAAVLTALESGLCFFFFFFFFSFSSLTLLSSLLLYRIQAYRLCRSL